MQNYRVQFRFTMLLHLLTLFAIYTNPIDLHSVKFHIFVTDNCALNIKFPTRSCSANKAFVCNFTFIYLICLLFAVINFSTWLTSLVLALSGDIHPNPGPSSTSSNTSNFSISDYLNAPNHLSFVHYNVQSLLPKVDLLMAELSSFDVVAFSETWLSESTDSVEIMFPGFHSPIRKDRPNDRHGGVIIYVKDTIAFVRRPDLEANNTECIWVELKLCRNKNVLFAVLSSS